jgi:hypothetical protein
LLGEILDDGEIVRRPFAPPSYVSEGLAVWETLRDEMMYQNRWFLNVSIDLERPASAPRSALAPELPHEWFRARIRSDDGVFPIDQMGAPPKRRASHGRANPAGIPYLYLGSKAKPATAEIRPHTRAGMCCRLYRPDIRAVDLRNPASWSLPSFYGCQ